MDNFSADITLEEARITNIKAIKLQWFAQPKSLVTLIDIFAVEPELFYSLACVGVPDAVAQPARQLAAAAMTLRMISYNGFHINEPRKGAGWLLSTRNDIPGAWFEFAGEEYMRVYNFMMQLRTEIAEDEPATEFRIAFNICRQFDAVFMYRFIPDTKSPPKFNTQACLDSVMCRMREGLYVAVSPLFNPVRASGETEELALKKFATALDDAERYALKNKQWYPGYAKPD